MATIHILDDIEHEFARAKNKHLGVKPPVVTADMIREASIEAKRREEEAERRGYDEGFEDGGAGYRADEDEYQRGYKAGLAAAKQIAEKTTKGQWVYIATAMFGLCVLLWCAAEYIDRRW